MVLKRFFVRLHWIVAEQFGLDLIKLFKAIRGLPNYVADYFKFKAGFSGYLVFKPCLGDRFDQAGATSNEYFWQDLLVARQIFLRRPDKHVDVGSRIDGFVAHVASFREVEVFDIRLVTTSIPGVQFRRADFMSADSVADYVRGEQGYCDSLSCLHAIEHFGLGRYGDQVDPQGYVRGIGNLAKLLVPGGRLYLSTPIGRERVEFNANWVFAPATIVKTALAFGLTLNELTVLDQRGNSKHFLSPGSIELVELAAVHYQLGIFHFIKKNSVSS